MGGVGVGPVASPIWYTEIASSPPVASSTGIAEETGKQGHTDDQQQYLHATQRDVLHTTCIIWTTERVARGGRDCYLSIERGVRDAFRMSAMRDIV